jgi:hypothetical protein
MVEYWRWPRGEGFFGVMFIGVWIVEVSAEHYMPPVMTLELPRTITGAPMV